MILGFLICVVMIVGGILILGFLRNKKKDTEEHEKRLGSLEEELYSQRDQQTQQMLEHAKATRSSKPETSVEKDLRIARNGQDLGEMKIEVIRAMLDDGRLSPEDFYLDAASNEWMPLECHPALIR